MAEPNVSEEWVNWVRTNYPDWHYDKPGPSVFTTKNDGLIVWLQYSKYRMRLSNTSARIYWGPYAKHPVHALDYRDLTTFTAFLNKLHKVDVQA